MDEDALARGRGWFATLGCAACHVDTGVPPPASRPPALAELDPSRGCLAGEPEGALPRYAFADGDRSRLARRIEAGAVQSYSSSAELDAALELFACSSCHARDGAGGPPQDLRGYFRVATDAELGDEGRIPPHLDRVGWKLEADALAAVLEGAGRVRPYMRTRMPSFGRSNVGHLPALFAELDTGPEPTAPRGNAELYRAGQRLAGTKGLGCIQCHEFGEYESLGVPAVDLTEVVGRIRYPWFRELLLDPGALNMNTRMPAFWRPGGSSPVRDVFDGDVELQIEALWSYLSLGRAMPIPFGLAVEDGDYELVPVDEPIAIGVFWQNASPRTLLVGHPELIHYAYDVEHSRLVTAWRGRFFNAAGTWHGRAGKLEEPPTDDVLELPPGAPFAFVEGGEPVPAEPRVLGRRYDEARRPVFRYAIGDVVVEESIVPLGSERGLGLERRFVLRASAPVDGLVLRTAEGLEPVRFEAAGDGATAEIRQELRW